MPVSGTSGERLGNTQRVLRALGSRGPLTLADLRAATGLSRPTVTAILAELGDDGLVVLSESRAGASSSPGRPARLYSVNPSFGYVAGVDVGLHKVLVVVADGTGVIRHRFRHRLDPDAPGDVRLREVQNAITRAAGALGVDVADLLGLCLGVPGIIDESGRITRSSVISDWTGFHLGREMSNWAGGGVDIANDANLAAAGERWAGAARLRDDVIYLLLGRRMSAGILLGGRIHRGRNGASGEIGSIGALYVDPPAILLGESTGQDDPRIPAVFERAAAGDADASARTAELYDRVGAVVDTLAKTLDPDVVVLGGGLSRAGTRLRDGVAAATSFDADVAPPIVLGELADEAGALGGARAALVAAGHADPRLLPLVGGPATWSSEMTTHAGADAPDRDEPGTPPGSETTEVIG